MGRSTSEHPGDGFVESVRLLVSEVLDDGALEVEVGGSARLRLLQLQVKLEIRMMLWGY